MTAVCPAQAHKPAHVILFLCCHAVLGAAATGASGCAWRADTCSPWVCAQQLQAPALHSLACALSQAVVACNNIVHALLLQHAAGQGKGQAAPGPGQHNTLGVSTHSSANNNLCCAAWCCDSRVQAATRSRSCQETNCQRVCAASILTALTDLMLSFSPYSMARLGVYGVLPAGLVFSWSIKS